LGEGKVCGNTSPQLRLTLSHGVSLKKMLRGRATRPKKLNSKQNVQIFREDQVESLSDYDTQRSAIETGVEKAEESVSSFTSLPAACLLSQCPLLPA
jgi:hypothetical protein